MGGDVGASRRAYRETIEKAKQLLEKIEKQKITFPDIPKSEIISAFSDLLDGQSVEDIRKFTGLREERCLEIYNLYLYILKKKGL